LMRTGSLWMHFQNSAHFFLIDQHFCATFIEFSVIWWQLVLLVEVRTQMHYMCNAFGKIPPTFQK
jgi:hypothetical protein